MYKSRKQEQGFTLVEMSIVLVIIGLIVGGVLVGQDLVKGAQVRATVAQIQQFDAAVNTFRGKYDQFPGDMVATKAAAFGFATPTGTAGNLGNGRLDDASTVTVGNAGFDGELSDFWVHLTNANMVGGSYITGGTTVDVHYPGTKLKKGGIMVVSSGSINYWFIGVGGASTTTDMDVAAGKGIAPAEAFGIDQKLDDGMSNTGIAFHVVDFTAALGVTGADLIGTVATSATTCWATTPATAATAVDYQMAIDLNNCRIVTRVQG